MDFFSVNTIAFSALGYDVSWLELVGTILYFAGVIYAMRRNVLTWPVSIVATILYLLLFWQIRLYADTAEQIFYIVTSFYGWWLWGKSRKDIDDKVIVQYSDHVTILSWIGAVVIASTLAFLFLSHAHEINTTLFPEPAAFPLVDGTTTVMSFVATWLLIQKRTESWIYWVVIDVIAVVLYLQQGVALIALQYVFLIFLAARGWWMWHKKS